MALAAVRPEKRTGKKLMVGAIGGLGCIGLAFGLGVVLSPSPSERCPELARLRIQEQAWEEQLHARLEDDSTPSELAAALTQLESTTLLVQSGKGRSECLQALNAYAALLPTRRSQYEQLEAALRALEGERRTLLSQLEGSAGGAGLDPAVLSQSLKGLIQLQEQRFDPARPEMPPTELLGPWWKLHQQVQEQRHALETLLKDRLQSTLALPPLSPLVPVQLVGKALVLLGTLIMLGGLLRSRFASRQKHAVMPVSQQASEQATPAPEGAAAGSGLRGVDEASFLLGWLSQLGELALLLRGDGRVLQATAPLELSLGLNPGGLSGQAGIERLLPERLQAGLLQRLRSPGSEGALRGWEEVSLKRAGGGEQAGKLLLLPLRGGSAPSVAGSASGASLSVGTSAGGEGPVAPGPSPGEGVSWLLLIRDQELQQQKRQLEEQMRSNTLQLQASSLELKRSRARQAAIFERAMDSILGIDAHGQVVECNPAAEEVFGVAQRGVLGLNLGELVISSSRTGRFHIGEGGEVWGEENLPLAHRREVTAVRPDGTLFPAEMQVVKVQMDPPLAYYVFLQDISERKRGEQLKNDFVSTVSHELRTPLTSIRGSLGLLEGGVLGPLPARVLEMIRIARSNSDRLIRLTSEMLDLEKMEAGRLTLRLEPLSAGELIETALAGVSGMAAQSGVLLQAEEVNAGTFSGDRDRLLQVLTNLLSNAIKFSKPGQEVRIQVAAEAGGLRFSVHDHGPGIPKERLPSLFKKFQQLESPDGLTRKGTGLGLAISRALVELHHGTLSVQSEVGKGSTFSFRLPQGLRHGSGTPSNPLIPVE